MHDAKRAIIFCSINIIELDKNHDRSVAECDKRPNNESKEVFEVIFAYAVVCKDTVMVHIIDAPVASAAMIDAMMFSLQTATLASINKILSKFWRCFLRLNRRLLIFYLSLSQFAKSSGFSLICPSQPVPFISFHVFSWNKEAWVGVFRENKALKHHDGCEDEKEGIQDTLCTEAFLLIPIEPSGHTPKLEQSLHNDDSKPDFTSKVAHVPSIFLFDVT